LDDGIGTLPHRAHTPVNDMQHGAEWEAGGTARGFAAKWAHSLHSDNVLAVVRNACIAAELSCLPEAVC
jgi:hypothetical protein